MARSSDDGETVDTQEAETQTGDTAGQDQNGAAADSASVPRGTADDDAPTPSFRAREEAIIAHLKDWVRREIAHVQAGRSEETRRDVNP